MIRKPSSFKTYLGSSLLALSVGALNVSAAETNTLPACSCTSSGSIEDNFQHGWHELNIGAASLYSNVVRGHNRPNIDYAIAYASVGYMVTQPGENGFFRGSFEIAPEAFGGGIYWNSGTYLAGGTLWFKYNFVQPDWKVVPYLEVGGGGTTLNISHAYDGKDFNFNLDAAFGLHYFIRPDLALNAEYRFQHISNADLWRHNVGVNTSGPAVGVSWFF